MNTSTLTDLWATRPIRQRPGRKIAGVCSGFGARYDIDPTLVRVAFVVATIFGGSGILLYIVAVVALPALPGEGAPLRIERRSTRQPWALSPLVVWIVVAIVFISAVSGGRAWGSGGIAGTVLMLIGWWLLYQRTPIAPRGTAADQLARASAATTGPDAETAEQRVTPDGVAEEGGTPPPWDPMGTAAFAWDLPEPPEAPEPPFAAAKQPKNPLSAIVAGVAVLAAVAGTIGNLVGIEWFTVGRIASLALAVLGVGMLVAALQRRPAGGHADGLVGLALLTATVAVIATLAHQHDWSVTRGGVGDREWQPRTESALLEHYRLGVGSSTLDLRELESISHDRTINVEQGVGDLVVLLPQKVRVRADCSTGIGSIRCPQGIVGDEAGPILTIRAHNGMGDVEMKK